MLEEAGPNSEGNVDSLPRMQFSEDEVQNLKEIFDLFDKERRAAIHISDLEAIMQSLQRDPLEAKVLLEQVRQGQVENIPENRDLNSDYINFDDFLRMMEHVEHKMARDDPHNIHRQNFIS